MFSTPPALGSPELPPPPESEEPPPPPQAESRSRAVEASARAGTRRTVGFMGSSRPERGRSGPERQWSPLEAGGGRLRHARPRDVTGPSRNCHVRRWLWRNRDECERLCVAVEEGHWRRD